MLGHVSDDDEGGNKGTSRRPSSRKACLRALTPLVWQHVAQWSLGRLVTVGWRSTHSFPFPIQASLAAGEGDSGDCSAADWMEALRAAIRAQGPFTFAYQNPQAGTT